MPGPRYGMFISLSNDIHRVIFMLNQIESQAENMEKDDTKMFVPGSGYALP